MVELFVDKSNKEEIMAYRILDSKHKKKSMYIDHHVLNRIKNTDLYDKEDISEKAKNVYAMKYFKGGENYRIYCQENFEDGKKKIVMSALYQKKEKKISAKTKAIIETVGGYVYEYEYPV